MIRAFVAEAEAAPDELSTIANIMPAPPMPFLPEEQHGRLVIIAMLVYAGDVKAGERAVAPFRALAEPIADMVRPMPLSGDLQAERGGLPPGRGRAHDVRRHDRPLRGRDDRRRLQASTATMAVTQLRVLGGAMARVPGRGDRVRAPAEPDHGQRRGALRAARGGAGARGLGRPASPTRSARTTRARTSTSSATRARSGSAPPTRARPGTGSRR